MQTAVQQGKRQSPAFPFTAILGQEDMKLGLILNIIDPKIGGILVFGEKGTAKSTAIRGLAELLPEITVVKDCPFHCDPADPAHMCSDCRSRYEQGDILEAETIKMQVVDLPVSATEDRVVGSLDLEEAIQKGKKRFDLGVLAKANRGILYVDEINLLDDHIVDLLLDCAAMGVNTVEREGVSFSHPANFILVGTMNPEEGELRPQLLDRFGFSVEIKGIKDPKERIEIVKRCSAFQEAPKEFIAQYAAEEAALAKQITEGKRRLKQVAISDEILLKNAELAIGLGVDGHRGDLTMVKGIRALAALQGKAAAEQEELRQLSEMVFRHRMKTLPFEKTQSLNREVVDRILSDTAE